MEFDSFVLTASTADLTEEPAAREHADAIEFRMDLADDPLAALEAYDGDLPILATNRADWEGGEATEPEDDRLEALAEASRLLAAIREGDADDLLETIGAREPAVSVVASAHDFDGTPDEAAMVETLTEACEHGDVGKLAVTAHDRSDALAVLSATHRLTADGRTVATMAMGEAGSHTRAVAPVYGSRIGYAPVDPENATAPGQYDLETLARLVESLAD
ncbi:3-dehydroquinate dehydratase [Halobiforma lacisalsi AJ5]|uniref:3-dehydroquinate dehydratase n=1 Tax=Natronobacterium lacisalsi AJ5 TaxID=358396 RepID=A0A1P8LL57_NATLA|nr:type I 3-dehydroquinate dehydratase [Halobiforma lacisalsi]APW96504.1 3-dehydroquinate dehydratase [Halobiforma lacisalsi AJ5]